MKIEGCVALVTGANRGIGEALVHELLAKGAAKVYAGVRNPAAMEALGAIDKRVVPLELDVSRPEHAQAAARTATDVNLLINNAGIAHYGVTLLDDDAVSNLRDELEVNLFGILHMFPRLPACHRSQPGRHREHPLGRRDAAQPHAGQLFLHELRRCP